LDSQQRLASLNYSVSMFEKRLLRKMQEGEGGRVRAEDEVE
jgi:hypothetical protein